MAMTHERLAVSSGLHTILTNYRFSGSPNLQNPQPTTSLLDIFCIRHSECIAIMSNEGLETRVVGWRRDKHPHSRYRLQMTDKTTLTTPMFSLRSLIFEKVFTGRHKVTKVRKSFSVANFEDRFSYGLSWVVVQL